jgi:hypothetical protein
MWLESCDVRQIRALALLERRHPYFTVTNAMRRAQRIRSFEVPIDEIEELACEAESVDDRRKRLLEVIAVMDETGPQQRSADPYYLAAGTSHLKRQRPLARMATALRLVLDGATVIEVAAHFGISKNAADVLLMRARDRAREVLRTMEAA